MINKIIKSITPRGRHLLFLSIAFFTMYALSGTAMMLLLLNMIEKILQGQEITLSYYWLGLIGLLIFKAVCNAVADLSKHYAGFDIGEATQKNLLLRLKCFSLGFYTKERVGEISTVIQKDVTNFETIVAHMWSRMISDFMIAIILGIDLFIVNWKLGLSMISLLPIAILLLIYGIKSDKVLQKESQDDLADMVSLFVEYVKGIPLLKAFSESSSFQTRLTKSTERFGESSKKISKSFSGILGRYSLIVELCFAILATVGAYLLLGTGLSVFDYLIFIIISREFYKPFVGMEGHYMNYIKVADSYRRIQTLLDAPIIEVPQNPRNPKRFDIAFDDVGFFYQKGEFELKKASFQLNEGSLTALVGPSGSGKTTVTNLLLRFWEPQKGVIRIGDIDIREIDYDELLGNISIVMQNVILFADTIEGNIKVGNRKATRKDVIDAAKKAMIHDFIISLPLGYDTPIGENGVGLSGGQKQRISIARAFLKNAPIAILDEITSNVDPVNEAKIQQAISNLAKNRTVLVIAHHLRTIRTADNILVFNDGQIVQAGVHDELIKQDGMYQTLWQSQEAAKEWVLAPQKIAESMA